VTWWKMLFLKALPQRLRQQAPQSPDQKEESEDGP
jgi:hypothetical protein